MLSLRKNSHFESFMLLILWVSDWEGSELSRGARLSCLSLGMFWEGYSKRQKEKQNLLCFHAFYWHLREVIHTLGS